MPRRKNRSQHLVDLVVPEAQSVTLRSVTDSRIDVEIQTRRGMAALVLLAREGQAIRVVDLRPRDKKKRKTPRVSVPFQVVKLPDWSGD